VVNLYRVLNKWFNKSGFEVQSDNMHNKMELSSVRNVMVAETLFLVVLSYMIRQKETDVTDILTKYNLYAAMHLSLLAGIYGACWGVWLINDVSYRTSVIQKPKLMTNPQLRSPPRTNSVF
jgi:hypothetical protein